MSKKMSQDGRIVLTAEDGSEEAFFVVEKAEIAGREYLLVTNEAPPEDDGAEEEDAEGEAVEQTALILRVNREKVQEDSVYYDVVGDEKELTILSRYFEELLDDVDISM